MGGRTLASTSKDVPPQDHLSAFDANAHSLSSSMPCHIVECDNHHVLDVVHPVAAVSSSVLSLTVDCDAHTARAQVRSCASCLPSPASKILCMCPAVCDVPAASAQIFTPTACVGVYKVPHLCCSVFPFFATRLQT